MSEPTQQSGPTLDQVIARYIEIRDEKADFEKKYKEEKAVYDAKLEKIEAYLLRKMDVDGATSIKTDCGTAFKKLNANVSLNDPELFKNFVLFPIVDNFAEYLKSSSNIQLEAEDIAELKNLLMESGRWGVSELRASKTGVKEYIEEKNEPVPGVTVNQVTVVNVRRN